LKKARETLFSMLNNVKLGYKDRVYYNPAKDKDI